MPPLKHLLVIDDNAQIRELLAAILGRIYRVTLAANGDEGLLIAQRDLPDAILCDLLMPQMGGAEMIHSLRSNSITAHIPVVLMSGRGDETGLPETGKPNDFLQKPFLPEQVHAVIANVLAPAH